MISEDLIKLAVEEAAKKLVEESQCGEQYEHQFSPKFERKMKMLIYKTKHPVFYGVMRSVASVLLVLSIVASLVLAVNVEARAKVLGWVQKQLDGATIYYGMGGNALQNPSAEFPEYMIKYVPSGYEEILRTKNDKQGLQMFADEEGFCLTFTYLNNTESTTLWVFGADGSIPEIEQVMIGEDKAEYRNYKESTQSDSLLWIDDETDILFSVSGLFSLEELIEIAESVTER